MKYNEFTIREALTVQINGCPDYIHGECDDCGLCEVAISEEILNHVEEYGLERTIGGI